MDLFWIVFISLISLTHCFNIGRFSCLLNLTNINTSEISLKESNTGGFLQQIYTPKSGVQIFKVTDGVNIIWEDRKKLTECISATTHSRKNLIQLIHLEIKRTSVVREKKYFKRYESKFIDISDKEYDLLICDSSFGDNTVAFDINTKKIDENIFKHTIRPYDGVPTLLLEPQNSFKLVSINDDFRVIWSKKSSENYVENLIAYYFFEKYYLVMLKLFDNGNEKYACFTLNQGQWVEVEYYTFMNKFLRLKSHIHVSGYLSFDILQLPDDQQYLIEKDEKYSIELSTYYPKKGFQLNSVMKGENIIWESAKERCASIRLVKKNGTIYGINLSLIDDYDKRTTLNFIYEEHVYREVSEEDFKTFGQKLVDPEELKKYRQESGSDEVDETDQCPGPSEVIIETDYEEYEDEVDETEPVESIPQPKSYTPTQSSAPPPSQPQQEQEKESPETQPEPEPETEPEPEPEPRVLDINSYDSRLFMRNSFSIDNVDTFEYIPMPKISVVLVKDGSILIWDNSKKIHTFSKLYVHHKKEFSQLIKLLTRVTNGDVTHFFKRHNAEFESIGSKEYDTLFQKMGSSINLLENSILLNLSSTPKENYFDYQNEFDNGVNVSKFVTKSMFRLVKITDGKNVLWQTKNNEKCTSITRNKFSGKYELIYLNISSQFRISTKYFKKTGNTFSEIDLETYNSEYKAQKDSIPFVANISLNINKAPNEVYFLYNERLEGKYTQKTYFPRSGYILNKVSAGSNVLWTSTTNRSKKVSVFNIKNTHTLVKISFSNPTTPELYFNLLSGKFVKLRNFIEFDFTLKDYSKNDTDIDQCTFCNSQLERNFTLDDQTTKISLNTNVDNTNIYTCFKSDSVMNKIFVPKDGFAFNTISDGFTILFNSSSDSKVCVYINVYYDNKGPKLAKLRTLGIGQTASSGSLIHLEILDAGPENLTLGQFESKLNDLKDEMAKSSSEQKKKIPIDISLGSIDTVENVGTFLGLNYKEFKAKTGVFFSKIIFSQDLVYSLDSNEDCFSVKSYFFLDFVVLAELEFLLSGDATTKLYLYRYSNDLSSFDVKHFNNLLKSISHLVSKCQVLDLGDYHSSNIYVANDSSQSPGCSLNSKLFTSGNKRFTLINVNNSKVWGANSDLFLARNVHVHYMDNNPYLIKISLENLDSDETNMFYEFVNQNWNPINYTEYTNRLKKYQTEQDTSQQSSKVPEMFDVDIVRNINPEHILYKVGKANGLTFIEVSLKDLSKGISSVSNDGLLMWSTPKKNFVCKKSFVYYFENIPQLLKLQFLFKSKYDSFIYKHVSNGYWVEIDEDIFTRKLASFESSSKVPKEPELPRKVLSKLDTAKIDPDLVNFTTHKVGNLPYNQYKPASKSSFVEVFDSTLIWMSDSNYECNLVRIYLFNNVSVLSKLFLTNDLGIDRYLYFNKKDGSWEQINSNLFETKLEEFINESSDPPSTEPCEVVEECDYSDDEDLSENPTIVNFNINNFDPTYFHIAEGNHHSVPFTQVKAKSNTLINIIQDAESTLWSKQNGAQCTNVNLYHPNNITELAELIVRNERIKLVFLKKIGNTWRQVDEDDDYEREELITTVKTRIIFMVKRDNAWLAVEEDDFNNHYDSLLKKTGIHIL